MISVNVNIMEVAVSFYQQQRSLFDSLYVFFEIATSGTDISDYLYIF